MPNRFHIRPETRVLMADRIRGAVLQAAQERPVEVVIQAPRRSLDQNAKLWAVLSDVSRQVDWHGQRLSKEEWKDVMTAALKRQKVVPGLDGGFVVLGTSTRRMSKQEFSDLLELIQAFGAEQGVEWGDTAAEVYDQYREARA